RQERRGREVTGGSEIGAGEFGMRNARYQNCSAGENTSQKKTLRSHDPAYVIATRLDRALPGLQLRVEHVPDMNHFGPNLQIDADIVSAGRLGQPDRVVKQGLRRADLDQKRRQAFEIGIDWRGQWRARVGTGVVE